MLKYLLRRLTKTWGSAMLVPTARTSKRKGRNWGGLWGEGRKEKAQRRRSSVGPSHPNPPHPHLTTDVILTGVCVCMRLFVFVRDVCFDTKFKMSESETERAIGNSRLPCLMLFLVGDPSDARLSDPGQPSLPQPNRSPPTRLYALRKDQLGPESIQAEVCKEVSRVDLVQSFSHSLILSFSHSLILSFSHSLILSFSHSLILCKAFCMSVQIPTYVLGLGSLHRCTCQAFTE